MLKRRTLVLLAALLAATACKNDDEPSQDELGMELPDYGCEDHASAPPDESLLWKRVAAFDADLRAALDLEVSCLELGTDDCAGVHAVPLGGNDPFGASMYRPVAEPLATTPIAVERVVLGACARRAGLDAEGSPGVFTDLDFGAGSVSDAQARATGEMLVRRLLGRDATADELDTLGALTSSEQGDPVSPRDFATLSCFAVGSTTEFFFF